MVLAVTVIMTLTAGVLVGVTVNNDPLVQSASIQRYSYRALQSGLDAYQSAINADPVLASCNVSSTSADCAPLQYVSWSQVAGTDVGNGVVPEYYKFDNPQQITDPTTDAVSYLQVQVVGAAGYPGDYVYQSTVARFTPENGFLDHVWWSNYESFDASATGSAADCQYYHPSISTGGGNNYSIANDIVGTSPCEAVYFGPNDTILGPLFSNDSLFVDGKPNFGTASGVQTADQGCLFVDPAAGYDSPTSQSPCASTAANEVGSYSTAKSAFGQLPQPLPVDDSELATVAKAGGCYYQGPTTVTLNAAGTMRVTSPDTTTVNAGCPLGSTGSLPPNGVLFVDSAAPSAAGPNPFDGATQTTTTATSTSIITTPTSTVSSVTTNYKGQVIRTTGPTTTATGPGATTTSNSSVPTATLIDAQTQATCSGCYYGQTGQPDAEADVFVSGSLSGQLTIGSANDIIVDGGITYADCSWVATASESICKYNSTSGSPSTNDTLGLVADNYVEIDRPVDTGGNVLACGTTSGTVNQNPVTSTTTTNGSTTTTTTTTGSGVNLQTTVTSTTPGSSIQTTVNTSVTTAATFAAPMCDPSTATGAAGGKGLTVDAALLADGQSFVVNNYKASGLEGTLDIYGSISQDARGPVAIESTTGYYKYYLWDPRLTLYAPPYYLTPGTASWALDSSAVNYASSCPPVPDPDPVPSPTPTPGTSACVAP